MVIKLKDLIKENMENRVATDKIKIIMEKIIPEVKKAQSEKLLSICAEVQIAANALNSTKYSIHLVEQWNILKIAMITKLMELKEAVLKLNEKKINTTALVRAIDEVILD